MTGAGRKPWSRIARGEGRRMIRFGGVGVVNTITDFALFGALIAAGASPAPANIAGFLGANLQSYLLNSRITFRVGGRPAALSPPGYMKFLAAHAMSLVASTAMVVILADRVGPLPAKAAAVGFTFVWNYAMSAIFVFARRNAASEGESGGYA